MLSRYLFRGRRRQARRDDESQIGYYVDRQTPFELVAVFSLFALTLTDALATLHILGKGGTELNPIMRSALEVGDHYFLITKLGISLLGGILILIHARFPAVKKSLFALITLYAGVVIYHIYLISSALR